MPLDDQDLEVLRQRSMEGRNEWPGVSTTAPAPGLSPEDMDALRQRSIEQPGAVTPEQTLTEPAVEPGPPVEPDFVDGMMGRVVDHLLGRDVDDPMPWTRMGTTLTGAIGGTVLGAQVPGGPLVKAGGAIIGGSAFAVGGAVAPELTMEALEAFKVIPPGTRDRLGLSNDELRLYAENETLTEIALMGGLSAARWTGRGFTAWTTGMTKESRRLAGVASRNNVATLPVMVGEGGKVSRMVVSVMGRFPLTSGGLRKRGEKAMDDISKMFDGIPARLGPMSTYDEASGDILREAKETARFFNDQFEEAWTSALNGAAMRGIHVTPVKTRKNATEILEQIGKETPKGLKGEVLPVERDTKFVREFIKKNIQPLYDELDIVGGPVKGVPKAEQRTFSMKQADTLAGVIQEGIVNLAKLKPSPANMVRMERLLSGVQADMLENAIGASKTKGPRLPGREWGGYSLDEAGEQAYRPVSDTQWYVGNMRNQEDDMAQQIAWLFDNAASQKMGISISARKTGVSIKEVTSAPESLARGLLRMGSPQIIDELAKVTGRRGPEPMQKLANAVFNEALQKGQVHKAEGVTKLDVDVFAKELGLDNPGSAKFLTTEKLLKYSGGLNMSELGDFVEIARRASRAEIPDVATFIARRGVMGGVKGVVTALMPWMVVSAGTGGGGAAGGFAGATVAGIGLIAGSRLYLSMISNPRSARAFKEVVDVSTSLVVKRAAVIRAWTNGIHAAVESGDMTKEEATEKTKVFGVWVQESMEASKIEAQRNE
jgi:hypothetical protein